MLVQGVPSLAYSFRQYAREFAGAQGVRGAPALHERHEVVLELAAALARSAPHLAQITGAHLFPHPRNGALSMHTCKNALHVFTRLSNDDAIS